MLEPTRDLTAAQWLAVEATEIGGTVDDLLPDGFAVYLRVFHRPDQGSPGDGAAASWSEVAQRHATVMHAEAQWTAITGGRDRSPHDLDDPESPSDQALTGSLDPVTLHRIADHLSRHTTTPITCHVALWNGTGKTPTRWDDFPVFRRPGRGYWLFSPVPTAEIPQISGDFELLGMEEEIHVSGVLSGLTVFGKENTTEDSLAWVRRERERGFVQSPSYWWPEDHAWVPLRGRLRQHCACLQQRAGRGVAFRPRRRVPSCHSPLVTLRQRRPGQRTMSLDP